MEQTAIAAGAPPNAGISSAITANPDRPRLHAKAKSIPVRFLEALSSLRLTVVLFTLAIFLVYFGTWAQKDAGIWTVVNQYFRSAIVWIPFKVLLMHSVQDISGSIPYPGGWLIGGFLLANLLAAHVIRFKMSWKRSGILMIHGGLILMMLGELVTGVFAIEGHMQIMVGNSSYFVERDRFAELAVIDRSDAKMDKETVIPGKLLERGGTITNDALPFDVEVVQWMANADLFDTGWREAGEKLPNNPATIGIGLRKLATPKNENAGAGDSSSKAEIHCVYVTLREKGTGNSLGTYLLSTAFSYMQKPLDEVVVDGKRYAFGLRNERDYRKYQIQLLKFDYDKYIGTEKAKNYSSLVVVKDENDKKGRQILIKMNSPMYEEGETFYQAGVHDLAKGTILQVVRNPGWWMPYISCVLVSGGMLVHFGLHLFGFLQRRFAS